MKSPTWKQRIQRSLHLSRSKPESKYFQVASIGIEGQPKARTMVFRGFSELQTQFVAVTDIRSEKYDEFTKNKQAEVCWYFAKTREQYRLSCSVNLHTSGSLVKYYWNCLSSSAKNSFSLPHPKVPIELNPCDSLQEEVKSTESSDTLLEQFISPNFVVIEFVPFCCDYLNLKSKPQLRTIELLNDENQWHATTVNA